jgi:branched-chain amino acid transport system ATP-binding protein
MLLNINNIDGFYGPAQVLHRLNLIVETGEVVCLLGRNGVGKSTTLKSIAGIIKVRSGSIQFKGKELLSLPPYRIARLGIGYVPEERRVFSNLTVHENLLVGVKEPASGKEGYWTIDRFYDMYPEIKKLFGTLGGHLSGGEQQLLTIGRTLLGNPDLVMIDEPTEGLAPLLKDRIFAMLNAIKASGTSILLVDNSINHVMNLANRVYVISKGEIVFEGSTDQFLREDEVRRQYLEV